jgi:NAD(P)H-nitrite reductase large subunit
MEYIDYVIVGGGIAGTNAAFKIRSLDPSASIRIYSDEPDPVYSRVTLGKFVYGGQDEESIVLKKKTLYQEKNIELYYQAVDKIDAEHRQLYFDGGELEYGKLLLATGGRPRPLPLKGVEKAGISYFQYLSQAKYIQEKVKVSNHIVVVGGGFIGIEFVDILYRMGKKCTLIVRDEWYWQNMLAKEGGEILDKYIQSYGEIKYQTEITEIHGDDHVEFLTLSNGEKIPCDALFIGIGIILNTDLAQTAGLAINRGIVTNEFLESSQAHIFAAGDVAEYKNSITGQYERGGTWVNASMQGLVAGQNMVQPQSKKFEILATFAPKIPVPVSFIGATNIHAGQLVKVFQNGAEYTQVHFEEGKLVGAVLINHSAQTGKYMELIKLQASQDDVESAQ